MEYEVHGLINPIAKGQNPPSHAHTWFHQRDCYGRLLSEPRWIFVRYWRRGFLLRAIEKSRRAEEQPLTRKKRDVKSSKSRQKPGLEGKVDRENKRNGGIKKKGSCINVAAKNRKKIINTMQV